MKNERVLKKFEEFLGSEKGSRLCVIQFIAMGGSVRGTYHLDECMLYEDYDFEVSTDDVCFYLPLGEMEIEYDEFDNEFIVSRGDGAECSICFI